MLSNRSRCYLALQRPQEALADAQKSLELDPGFAKAYEREGRALMALAVGDEATQLTNSLAAARAFSNAHKIDRSLKHSEDMTIVLASSDLGRKLQDSDKEVQDLKRQNHRLQFQLTAERKAKSMAQVCVLQQRREAQDSTLRLNYVRERMQEEQRRSQVMIAQLQQQVEEQSQSSTCIICLEELVDHVIRPCNHACVCATCAPQLPDECPICRQSIMSVERIFFA